MQERLLKIDDIAEIMGTSKTRARAALSKYGLYAIDFGRGRGGGERWLQSAVFSMLQSMASSAQKKSSTQKPPKKAHISIFNMSIDDVYDLTQNKAMQ